jgi:hypothetical protein
VVWVERLESQALAERRFESAAESQHQICLSRCASHDLTSHHLILTPDLGTLERQQGEGEEAGLDGIQGHEELRHHLVLPGQRDLAMAVEALV